MSEENDEKSIYLIFKRNGDMYVGHMLTHKCPDPDRIKEMWDAPAEKKSEPKAEEPEKKSKPEGFSAVNQAFQRSISMYRDAVVSTIRISPIVSSMLISRELGHYAQNRGLSIFELRDEATEVFKLPNHCLSEIQRKNDQAEAAIAGARELPQIATIGLISAYDAFLSDLLRSIFAKHPELVFTSDRQVKFSELMSFSSIESVRESIVTDEIEGVLRKSHHEQFLYMESKFEMKLRDGLDVWPSFIELCERRNLLTHTGGIVSEQYIKNCKQHKVKNEASLGDKLSVGRKYFQEGIEIIAEIGTKLTHTLWRKFAESERREADQALNECGMQMIQKEKYRTAERILRFGFDQKKHSSDLIRRMMIVNLANAIKLSGDREKATETLDQHDWSATATQFRMCVAAVRDEYENVCDFMRLGPETTGINASDFRDWPVFASCRENESVLKTFLEVYGEPFVIANKIEIDKKLVEASENGVDEHEGTQDNKNKTKLH